MRWPDEEAYEDGIDTIVDHDEDEQGMDDFDSYDEWVANHVNDHGPTAAGFDALAQMEEEGFFT